MNAMNALFLILIFTFLIEVDLYLIYVGSPFFVYLFFIYLEMIFAVILIEVFKTNS
jgi:hypothetical protein